MQKPSINTAGFIITFTGAILFSTKAVIVKHAFAGTGVDALSLLTLRMLFALPFYVGAALFAGRSLKSRPLTRRQWLQVLGLGLLGYYTSSLLDFEGLQYISAGLERLILFLYPSLAVLMNAVFFRQKVTRMQVWALLLTYAGIALACFGEINVGQTGPAFWWGCLLVLGCAITFAGYITGSGRLIPHTGVTRFTAYAMLAASFGVLLHFTLRGQYGVLHRGGNLWAYGLLLAIVATVIPTFLISMGMKRIGSNNVAIVSGIGPVATIVQAHFVLGEPITAMQIFGTALVIAGVLLPGWKGK